MATVALTSWFSIVTLFGPLFCCCVCHDHRTAEAEQTAIEPVAPACCQHNAPPQACAPAQGTEHDHPADCQCQHSKKIEALPQVESSGISLLAQLKWQVLIVECFSIVAEPVQYASHSWPPGDSPPKPYGRALLALCSILRC